MRPTLAAVLVVVALATSAIGAGETPAVFPPFDVQVLARPRVFVVAGVAHVAYELHIRNLSSRTLTIEHMEVRDPAAPSTGPALLRLEGATLDAALLQPGAAPGESNRRVLAGGRTAVLFAWVETPAPAVPDTLTHRFTVRSDMPAPGAASNQPPGAAPAAAPSIDISGVDVPVSKDTPPVMAAPLAGDLWLAGNGPDNNVGHRRVLMALAGEARIAQRFAVDWVRLFPEGRTFQGDPKDNRSYRAFGAEALAVADATVVETKDGIPDNRPDPVARAVPITPATVGGNFVLLDLGRNVYALYGHLQPGSLRVKRGDRVRRGQVLGLTGNSGNSTEPHLHFQVTDRRSAFDAEGIPYAIASFDLQADPKQVTPAMTAVGDSLGIDPAELGKWTAAAAQRRRNEMPMMNAIVRFPSR
jgi:murein DD-endopeptidase MepM/ murein hydrolase activator NlpD